MISWATGANGATSDVRVDFAPGIPRPTGLSGVRAPSKRTSDMTCAGGHCQPLVCSLSPDGLRERKALIDQLLARGLTGLAAIPGGARARFVTVPGLRADLEALVELEARCCAFLSLTMAAVDDAIVLDVTGPPEAQPLIAELFTDRAAVMTDR
jgi:hypothetical protein